jgi:hypothetical protein
MNLGGQSKGDGVGIVVSGEENAAECSILGILDA